MGPPTCAMPHRARASRTAAAVGASSSMRASSGSSSRASSPSPRRRAATDRSRDTARRTRTHSMTWRRACCSPQGRTSRSTCSRPPFRDTLGGAPDWTLAAIGREARLEGTEEDTYRRVDLWLRFGSPDGPRLLFVEVKSYDAWDAAHVARQVAEQSRRPAVRGGQTPHGSMLLGGAAPSDGLGEPRTTAGFPVRQPGVRREWLARSRHTPRREATAARS